MKKIWTDPRNRATLFLVLAVALAAVAADRFRAQWQPEPLFPSPYVTSTGMLSDYHEPLKGTSGDTPVFFFDSGVPGGTLLICGGTHPNEPAAYMAAVTVLENLRMTEGRAIVIPRANNAGFMHTESMEAAIQTYGFSTPHGRRTFRNGSRVTIPSRQWPDPTIYINPRGTYWDELVAGCQTCAINNPGPGGQTLAGIDSRNLNRVFPGNPHGTLTEQIGHAIITLIRAENVNLAIDYHEAAPEYPTINVMVAHERAADISSWAELMLSDDGVIINTDISALPLRGLSHREWGDADPDVLPVLFETANVAQGRLKGRTTEEQITRGHDMAYERVMMIQARLNARLAARAARAEEQGRTVRERSRRILHVNIPTGGIPMEKRVGRHLQATIRLVESYNDQMAGPPLGVEGLPEYATLLELGMGPFLHGPNGEPPVAHTPPPEG